MRNEEEEEERNVEETVGRILAQLDGGGGGSNCEEALQSKVPGPLEAQGKEFESVLQTISQSIYKGGEGQELLRLKDPSSMLSIVSHALSAYITTLNQAPLQRLSGRIASEVSLWMRQLFKFEDGAAFCHEDMREGLLKVTRMSLFKHYPDMLEHGFKALISNPPVIYLTSSTYLDVTQYICSQLGLPRSSIKVLNMQDDSAKKDSASINLQEIISEDGSNGRIPILCVANVYSSIFQIQDVSTFEKICRKNGIWLHLEGHALAGLLLSKENNSTLPTGDSMVLTLGSWIGIPAVPFVTLYKTDGDNLDAATAAGLSTVNPAVRLNCLPLWCVLRSLGKTVLETKIQNIFLMLEKFNQDISQKKSLRILSRRDNSNIHTTVEQLTNGAFQATDIYKTVSPALAFQYVSESPPDLSTRVPSYYDNLNSWLGQIMQRDCSHIPLEIVDVETTGYVLRLCPFENLSISNSDLEDYDLEDFLSVLNGQVAVLDATVCQRIKFIELISEEPQLHVVELSHWAGLGGVRYVPEKFINKSDENNKKDDEINISERNIQLVKELSSLDSAFSLGQSDDGKHCIRFGMVSRDTEIKELLQLVIKTGKDIDKRFEELKEMTRLVREGIEQAQVELKKESEEVLWQEGILRHVPVVGSFYNWISPLQKPNIKGRCLSLREGKIATTDEIFKPRVREAVHEYPEKEVSLDVSLDTSVEEDTGSSQNSPNTPPLLLNEEQMSKEIS